MLCVLTFADHLCCSHKGNLSNLYLTYLRHFRVKLSVKMQSFFWRGLHPFKTTVSTALASSTYHNEATKNWKKKCPKKSRYSPIYKLEFYAKMINNFKKEVRNKWVQHCIDAQSTFSGVQELKSTQPKF